MYKTRNCGVLAIAIMLTIHVAQSWAGPLPESRVGTAGFPMGATVVRDGCIFRVWAPYAHNVSVVINGRAPAAMAYENGYAGLLNAIWAVRVPGAKVSDRYQYLIDNGNGASTFVDPYAAQLTGYDSAAYSVIADHSPVSDHFKMVDPSRLVIYELHVGTFHADVKTGAYSFEGVSQELGYLSKLGVNALELMPINLNMPGYHYPSGFNWGYDGLDLFAINPSYGTPAEFKRFVSACHSHGIAVIVDVVYNHLAHDNFQVRYGGYSSPDFPNGAYFSGADPGPTPWGPRPNYNLGPVRIWIEDNALSWLTEYGADGERWDSVDNIRSYYGGGSRTPVPIPGGEQLLRDFNKSRPANKIGIAEDLSRDAPVTQRLADGGFGFDCRWNNELSDALRNAVSASTDTNRDLTPVVRALKLRFGDSAFHRVVYTEDHDTVGHPPRQTRLPASIDPTNPTSVNAKQLSSLASAILLTAPGIPMLFQGQEMADPRPFDFGRATYVDWNLAKTNAGIVKLYHDLIALRRNVAGHSAGLSESNIAVFHEDDETKTLAYVRYGYEGPGKGVVVVANFSEVDLPGLTIGLPEGGKWQVLLDTGSRDYNPGFGSLGEHSVVARPRTLDGFGYSATVPIGAYSAVILSRY